MSEQNRQLQLGVVINAEGVAAGAQEVKSTVKDMTTSVVNDTAAAGKSLASLGGVTPNFDRMQNAFSGVSDSVKKMVGESGRALQSWVTQVENSAAGVDKVTDATVNKFANRALNRGFDPAVVQPYIEGLRKLAKENKDLAEVAAYEAGEQKRANAERAKASAELANFTRSAQAARVELLSLGKTASEKFQIRAELLGLDKNAATQKIIADLKDAEKQAAAAASTMNSALVPATNAAGMSAKAYSAALRSVPAQITDIVVGLQGGQAPMTVLLQQGGQLRDMFGSVGGAARALGGAIAGMVNPFTIIGATAATFGYAAYQASEDVKALRLALIETGTQGVTSLAKLDAIAGNLNALGVSTSVASAALVDFVSAGVKVDDSLQDITKAAIDLERAGGKSVAEFAKGYAALAKDPLADLANLTLSTYQHIEALKEQGKFVEAVTVAQAAYVDASKNTTNAHNAERGPLQVSIDFWKKKAEAVWDSVKAVAASVAGIGASQTGAEELANLQKRRDLYASLGYDTSKEDARLDYLKRANAAGEQTNKNLQRENELKALLAAFDKNDDELQKLIKRNQLSADYKRLLDANLISQERYDAAMKKLEDKPKKTATAPKESLTEAQRALASYTGELQRRLEKEEKLTEVQKAQNFLSSLGATGQLAQVREFVLGAAQQVDALNETDAATKAATKAYQEHLREQEKVIDGYKRSADSVEKTLQKYDDEEQALIVAAEKNVTLSEAIALVELARLRELQAKKLAEGADGETLLAIQREITAREKLADAIGRKDSRDAANKAAKDAEAAWKRAAEKIQDSITDALMRGFEAGKGFAENLRDAVVNMFKTLVLRPVVEMGVRGGLSVLGLGGAAGGASAAEVLGNVGNAGSALNGLSQLGGLSSWLTDFGGSAANSIIKAGEIAYQAGFEKLGSSLMSLQEAGNFSKVADGLNMVGDGLGYLNAAVAASQGKWGQAVGAGIGTFFGGPIGSAIGGAIGGWADNAFGGGREYTTGTGIAGRFSGSNFAGRNYQDWRNDGSSGFFGIGASGSSSGTNYSAMDAALQKSLGATYGNILTQTAGFATALGANAASITGYQKDIKLSLGSDGEANKKAIAELFKGIANEVAAVVLDSRFMREGEGAADTLARLATNLTAVNGALDTLGDNLLTVSQSSGDAASSLVDAFGGLTQYQSAIATYYQRFYTQEERLAKTREQLNRQMGALGLSLPDTVEAYRALVNAQDISTEAGRKTYAALIGMSSAFADITDAAVAAQLKLTDVAKSLNTLLQSVTSARESVAGARNEINPKPVMSAADIRAAVLASTSSASTAAVNAAAQDLGAKTTAATLAGTTLKNAQSTAESKAALLATATTAKANTIAFYEAKRLELQALADAYSPSGTYINLSSSPGVNNDDAYKYNAATNRLAGFDHIYGQGYINTLNNGVFGSVSTTYMPDIAGFKANPAYKALNTILGGGNAALSKAAADIATASAAVASAQTALTTATSDKAAADAAAKAAQAAYTKAVDAWTVEASKSVPQLEKLRDETLRYYEAQKALAEGMTQSATNLRTAAASLRVAQLDPLSAAQQKQREFAQNYALALSTTGAVKASYADKLAEALPALSEAIKATSSTADWVRAVAQLTAQANKVADQLDATAPKDYQAESLALLDTIDASLAVLDDSTKAITRAIEASGGVTAAGLRAVVVALGGVPSFDVGTNYVPQDMFARIHQGEAIVPKAYNPFNGGAMGDTSRLESQMAQQTQQLEAMRAELRAITIHSANTAENTRSMDKNGVLVFTDSGQPLSTVAA